MFLVKKEGTIFVNKTKIDNSFCGKNLKNSCKKCQKFLSTLINDGFFKCPYGFTVNKNGEYFVCSLMVKKYCDLESAKAKKKIGQLETVPEVISEDQYIFNDFSNIEKEYSLKSNCFHDINNGNTAILDIIESINSTGHTSSVAQSLIALFDNLLNACRECKAQSNELVQKDDFISIYNFYKSKIALYDDCFKRISETIEKIKLNFSSYYENNNENVDKKEKSLFEMFFIVEYRIAYMNAILYDTYTNNKIKLYVHKMIVKLSKIFKHAAKNRNLSFSLKSAEENNKYLVYTSNDCFLALFILFENAVKYAIPGSEISILLTQDDGKTIVKILNKSNYISDSSLSHLKERGYSGENKVDGNGYGLHIVDSICSRTGAIFNIDFDRKESEFIAELIFESY